MKKTQRHSYQTLKKIQSKKLTIEEQLEQLKEKWNAKETERPSK